MHVSIPPGGVNGHLAYTLHANIIYYHLPRPPHPLMYVPITPGGVNGHLGPTTKAAAMNKHSDHLRSSPPPLSSQTALSHPHPSTVATGSAPQLPLTLPHTLSLKISPTLSLKPSNTISHTPYHTITHTITTSHHRIITSYHTISPIIPSHHLHLSETKAITTMTIYIGPSHPPTVPTPRALPASRQGLGAEGRGLVH